MSNESRNRSCRSIKSTTIVAHVDVLHLSVPIHALPFDLIMTMDTDYDPTLEKRALRRLVLYVLWIIFLASMLLALNTGLVFSLAQGLSTALPHAIGVPQMVQLLIYVGPVVLLCLEWYVWDIVSARRFKNK